MQTRHPKRTVRQNRWGNWRGYEGGKFAREFAKEPAQLVAGEPQGAQGGNQDMPESARAWLAENNVSPSGN